jgi:hypothetical protein
MGEISLSNGEHINVGRLLMRDSCDAKLYDSLFYSYESSQMSRKSDQWF